MEPPYTKTQGQYLAFIYYYTKIHSVPPAEANMQEYFKVSAPSVHSMVVTLEKRGFVLTQWTNTTRKNFSKNWTSR